MRAESGEPLSSLYLLNLTTLRWSEAVAQGGQWPDAQPEPSLAWAAGRLYLFAGSPLPMGELSVCVRQHRSTAETCCALRALCVARTYWVLEPNRQFEWNLV
jgi:hypothetical protein